MLGSGLGLLGWVAGYSDGSFSRTSPVSWGELWSEGPTLRCWVKGKQGCSREAGSWERVQSPFQHLRGDGKERTENMLVKSASGTRLGRVAKIL